MTNDKARIYEGMFLFPQSAAAELGECADHVKNVLQKNSAEILSFSKWDERKLGHIMKGSKRAIFFLTYFKSAPSKISDIERDCNFSEKLLRSLIISAEHIPDELITSSDGEQKLADEIKLRATKLAAAESGSARLSEKNSPEEMKNEAPTAPETVAESE